MFVIKLSGIQRLLLHKINCLSVFGTTYKRNKIKVRNVGYDLTHRYYANFVQLKFTCRYRF